MNLFHISFEHSSEHIGAPKSISQKVVRLPQIQHFSSTWCLKMPVCGISSSQPIPGATSSYLAITESLYEHFPQVIIFQINHSIVKVVYFLLRIFPEYEITRSIILMINTFDIPPCSIFSNYVVYNRNIDFYLYPFSTFKNI